MTEKEFITNRVNDLNNTLKKFPDDFIRFSEYNEMQMPKKNLVLGNHFFGTTEVITIEGQPVHQAEGLADAKFIIYSNRTKPSVIKIPADKTLVKNSVADYEKYLDRLMKQIESDYRTEVKGGKNSSRVINEIFRVLNLIRY